MLPKKHSAARQILTELLGELSPHQLRECYIKIVSTLRDKSLQDVSRAQGGISYWYLSEGIKGRRPLSCRMVKLLESALDIDLTPFLTSEDGK